MIPMPQLNAGGLLGFAGLTIGISLATGLFAGAAAALESGISMKSKGV
tara:strand:- start:437 stop:580 length:144 start_codon:yes stop_codon:yes gene_type:complete